MRPTGVGAGLPDFQAYYTSDPNFAAAWDEIGGQLALEGADPSQIDQAKTSLVNSLEQMASNSIGVTGDQAIASAKSYVMLGQTILGAANTVQNLVAVAATGSVATITSVFTGTLVGLATAAGVLSAGIGAAIVGVVSGLLNILQGAGFFGSPSTDVDIAGCGFYSSKSEFLVGCVGVEQVGRPFQISPGSNEWRAFPNPDNTTDTRTGVDATTSYSDRLVWYTINSGGLWKGGRWSFPGGTPDHPDKPNKRLVDIAFPNFAAVELVGGVSGGGVLSVVLAATNPTVPDFNKAFFAAWKANAEYQLNGLKSQPDELVLIHLLRLWNRSHQGPQIFISQGPDYISSLTQRALAQLSSTDPLVSGQSLAVNWGPPIVPAAASAATPAAASAATPAAASAATAAAETPKGGLSVLPAGGATSTGAKVAVAVAAAPAAVALGAVVYAYAAGKSIDVVFSGLFRRVNGWITAAIRDVRRL